MINVGIRMVWKYENFYQDFSQRFSYCTDLLYFTKAMFMSRRKAGFFCNFKTQKPMNLKTCAKYSYALGNSFLQ
jgi:hypothetical protein